MAQISNGCLNEVIIISLQEVINRPLKGNIPMIDNWSKIIFFCRQILYWASTCLVSLCHSIGFLCLVPNLTTLNIQEYMPLNAHNLPTSDSDETGIKINALQSFFLLKYTYHQGCGPL